jgi:uncharacterized protein (DUF305 family)
VLTVETDSAPTTLVSACGGVRRYAGTVHPSTAHIVNVLVALATAICLSSCSGPASDDHTHPASTDQPVVSGEPAGYNAQDVAFANSMLQNHKQGVDLSRPVPDRSANPKVIAFAAARASALQSDVAVLKVMLVQWNENPHADTGGGGGATVAKGMIDQATIARLHSLAGGKFDTLWLQSMIGLDQGAIEIANAEIAGKNNDDTVGLARQIVDARQADIGKMKQLLGG